MAASDGLSAPELILSLADSAARPQLTAAGLVAAGALLGIDPGAMRVAAARLVKQGVLAQRARGVYSLGERGGGLHRRVQAWRRVEEQIGPWDGRWIGVFTAHLGRSDKSSVRSRERALRLKGFAAAHPGLAVRPANLSAGLGELRVELGELGLDPGALLLGIDAVDSLHPIDSAALWQTARLECGYRDNCARLAASAAVLPRLDVQSAARETLLVGRAVMRDILVDPLLPEAMVNAALRRSMIDAMVEYDHLGKDCWRAFYRTLS